MSLIVQSGHLRVSSIGDKVVISGASPHALRQLIPELRSLLCDLIRGNLRLLPPPSPDYIAQVHAAVPEHDVSLLESLLAPHYELVKGNIPAKGNIPTSISQALKGNIPANGNNTQRLTRRRKETHKRKETKC